MLLCIPCRHSFQEYTWAASVPSWELRLNMHLDVTMINKFRKSISPKDNQNYRKSGVAWHANFFGALGCNLPNNYELNHFTSQSKQFQVHVIGRSRAARSIPDGVVQGAFGPLTWPCHGLRIVELLAVLPSAATHFSTSRPRTRLLSIALVAGCSGRRQPEGPTPGVPSPSARV
jgi:hypothetical protein